MIIEKILFFAGVILFIPSETNKLLNQFYADKCFSFSINLCRSFILCNRTALPLLRRFYIKKNYINYKNIKKNRGRCIIRFYCDQVYLKRIKYMNSLFQFKALEYRHAHNPPMAIYGRNGFNIRICRYILSFRNTGLSSKNLAFYLLLLALQMPI